MIAAPASRHSRIRAAIGVLLAGALVAACGASSGTASPAASAPVVVGPTATAAATSTPTPAPTTAGTPGPTETAGATSVPTTTDPCQVITNVEAGTLAHAVFGAGSTTTDTGGPTICSYTATGNVFEVDVAVAPDLATAQANEASFKADLESKGQGVPFQLIELPGCAGPTPTAGCFMQGIDAAIVTGSATVAGLTFSASAMYLLKGTTFLGFSDIVQGGSAPSPSDLEGQAAISVARLP